jgi:hypothetical protein
MTIRMAAVWPSAASIFDRRHWSSAGPIRAIFKDAFAAAGLPYFNPHSFRKTLALLGGFQAFPFPLGGPVDVPPCIRQRPFFIAGDWHGAPRRVRLNQ